MMIEMMMLRPLGLRLYCNSLLTVPRLLNSFYLLGEPRNVPKILTLFQL